MGSLLVIIFVSTLAFVWVRGTRRNRARWLSRLDLPGVWEREGDWGRLELSGELDHGRYRFIEGRGSAPDEAGTWRLQGHTLRLRAEDGSSADYDLRLFDQGKIGIDGPRRERRIYQKSRSNVVPLRGRSKG